MKLCDQKKLKQVPQESGSQNWACYPSGWHPWVRDTVKKLLGGRYEQFNEETVVESPGQFIVIFPDGSQSVLFTGCKPHDCADFRSYYLINPRTHDVSIIWKRDKEFIYFGSHEEFLKTNKIGEWLKEAEAYR